MRTIRFLWTWLGGRARLTEEEVAVERGTESLPATLLRRPGGGDGASWIVLHGVTRPGRTHPELVRFARALAASGADVLLPEIREWRELRLAPERTLPAVRASLDLLDRLGGADRAVGLVGFSFGAPLAIRAAAAPDLRGRIAGVVGFGAYFDVERTFRYQLTGKHEWRGTRERAVPDPYGRWIIAANYLTAVPEHDGAADVARALHRLAAAAGDRQVPARHREVEALGRKLRGEIAPERRELFDLLAPREEEARDPSALEALARNVAAAARRVSPELEIGPHLDRVVCPVELIHGRDDRLIPFTETLRLRAAFPEEARVNVLITRLFAHSREAPLPAAAGAVVEGARFLRTLRRVVGMV